MSIVSISTAFAQPVSVTVRSDCDRILVDDPFRITFAIAIALWLQTAAGPPISYEIGSWAPPWGIEYRVDRLSSFVLLLVSGMAAAIDSTAGDRVASALIERLLAVISGTS